MQCNIAPCHPSGIDTSLTAQDTIEVRCLATINSTHLVKSSSASAVFSAGDLVSLSAEVKVLLDHVRNVGTYHCKEECPTQQTI